MTTFRKAQKTALQRATRFTPSDELARRYPKAVKVMLPLARLLIMGYTIQVAARKLKKDYTHLRKLACLPEFKAYLQELERDYYTALDTKIRHLQGAAVKTLEKMLSDRDWRARDAAAEKLLRLNNKLDRLQVSGSIDHQHAHQHAHAHAVMTEDAMSPRQRELARELLTSMHQPKALPPPLRPDVLDVGPGGGELVKEQAQEAPPARRRSLTPPSNVEFNGRTPHP
jgi:hypothetical protein